MPTLRRSSGFAKTVVMIYLYYNVIDPNHDAHSVAAAPRASAHD